MGNHTKAVSLRWVSTAPGSLTVAPGATRDDTFAYGWCTAGFDTTDLREAKALLDELSCMCGVVR
jgi:hypothetical protein